MYTLDTNAIIYFLQGDVSAVSVLQPIFYGDDALYISTITELELFSFSKLTSLDVMRMEGFLLTVVILALDSRIARTAGALRRVYRLETPDSIIAATALLTGTTLLTRNVKDFTGVSSLNIRPI
ncbi:MAG TPA: PIN domain-containing protein [Patescibacteria group bacterium]|nr:PIN domain-containing protein [Patescibacteria group bacterium]